MEKITKLIIGLCGLTAIGLITYYVLYNEDENPKTVIEKPIKNAEDKTVVNATVIKDSLITQITSALNISGESFTPSTEEGVYVNASNDKLIVIKEDIWKKLIRKTKKKFPNEAEDCSISYPEHDLDDFKFVGMLTYYADNIDVKTTSAYRAREIRYGKLKSYAGGNICCDCEGGEPLVTQKVDAIIDK